MRILLIICFFFICRLSVAQGYEYSDEYVGRLDTAFLRSVVNIKSKAGTGTGFIVETEKRQFLVTNKHVAGTFAFSKRDTLHDSIGVYFYNQKADSSIFKILTIKMNGKLKDNVRPHRSEYIDIVAIELTDLFKSDSLLGKYSIPDTHLIRLAKIPAHVGVGFGSHVFAIGYPANLRFATTNFPIAKTGVVASALNGNLDILVEVEKGKAPLRFNKMFFMVDGLIIGGNSGGPIVAPREFRFLVNKDRVFDSMIYSEQNPVLGIVSFGWENTGLTVIYPCDYILDLIQ